MPLILYRIFEPFSPTAAHSVMVRLKLRTSAALAAVFTVSVKEIKLYNAKVMSDAFDYSGYWWVNDSLKIQNEKYVLNIQIANIKKEETIIVIFDNAEVFRS